jgi:hypothetical protein
VSGKPHNLEFTESLSKPVAQTRSPQIMERADLIEASDLMRLKWSSLPKIPSLLICKDLRTIAGSDEAMTNETGVKGGCPT